MSRIELRRVAVQPRRALVAAHGTTDTRTVVLARVWDRDGAHGWGECVAFETAGYLNETLESAWSALRRGIAPAVHDHPFESPDDLAGYLAAAHPQAPVARATIEMAAWDLLARKQGRSLSNLLGGTQTAVATGKTIGLEPDPEELANEVLAAAGAGFQRIKIKIEPDGALRASRAAVEAAAGLPVVADANGSFATRDLHRVRSLDAAGLAWIEQPLPAPALRATADLRSSMATPVALDESADSVDSISRIIETQAAQALSIKPGRLGGHAAARQAYRMAKSAGLHLWIGGMLETGIGRAHNLALASLAGFDIPGDMGPSSEYWERDLITEPFVMAAGHIAVPDGPGIGVDADLEYLEAATLERVVFG